ncbi:MAG TPA: aldo/keto reductase [Chitinophagaceae bacterium]|nr:aldo/keto reductase [Chitinophagaceae bacterium]
MEYRKLGKTNLSLSVLGFGASPLGNVFEDCDEAEGARAVHLAIDLGINFFDVAPFYGITLAETRLGSALLGKRHQVILATKCGRNGLRDFDFSYNSIVASADASLKRLRTDYVDLMQLHDIEFGSKEQVLNEAVPAIQKIKASGKARFIGITGLPVNYLAEIARTVDVDTVLSWAHYNLLADGINAELVPLSKEKGFGLMNAAPLMQRILSDAPIPSWHNAPREVKAIQPVLLAICKKYGVSLSDLAIWYSTRHPHITSTIVGMCDTATVQHNIKALDLNVPAGLLEEIAAEVAPIKNRMWFEGRPENNIERK